MVLRMVFEQRDLERVRVAADADPMWELVLGVQMAQVREVPRAFVGWRQDIGRRLSGIGGRAGSIAMLRDLVPATGNFPDFLTPHESVIDIDDGCEVIACTPRMRLATDLAAAFAGRTVPLWAVSLAGGDRDALASMLRAIQDGHSILVAPQWAKIRRTVVADRAKRSRELVNQGVGALLRNLPGVLGWDGRNLETRYPVDRTVLLAGRGLILLPSYFCWGNPITWIDPELPPVLVYQAQRFTNAAHLEGPVPARLVSLLGRTRAEGLRLLLTPHTTSELAQGLAVSVGCASKQATVLREAGLITSSRHGAAVVHSTTSLGAALLAGELPAY